MTLSETWLIVGLGNPGRQYIHTRHNIGFMAVDALKSLWNIQSETKKFSGLISEASFQNRKIFLLKPQTFMNLSGLSVRECLSFYKIPPEQMIVIHDDIDLEPGKMKTKIGGGDGGHNGLKSIDSQIGKNYHRLRLGVGHPGHKDLVSDYVLGAFSKADEEWITPLLQSIENKIKDIINGI